MEAVPRGIDMPEMVRQMLRVPGVRDVHDLHVWSVGSGLTMLSCHVRIDEQPLAEGLEVIQRLGRVLRERFGIAHCTIQPETTGCVTTDLYCALPCGCCDEEPSASSTQLLRA
jgi:cobalt-zinc-cadmium efflux system protein